MKYLISLLTVVAMAQDAVVVPIHKDSTELLAKKYAAFEKAKAEWTAAKDKVDAIVKSGGGFNCGVTYSKDFTAAVPSPCPEYKPLQPWGGAIVTPAVGHTTLELR